MSTRMAGNYNAEDFKNLFGLESVAEGDAYSKGSSTGTKQVGALGTYMTEDDFNRLRNRDDVWDAYGSVYGEDAMKDKREGNEDGLSINALDALFDRLSADAPAADPAPEKPILAEGEKFSPQLSQAILETEKYEMELPYYGTKLFNDRNSEVYGYDKVEVPQYDYRTDSLYGDRIDPQAAATFAKKYKLNLADNFLERGERLKQNNWAAGQVGGTAGIESANRFNNLG